MNQELQLEPSSFREILPLWSEHLWPGRVSPIREISPISHERKYEEAIRGARPSFWALKAGGETVGSLSGYATSPSHYRVRGLYVKEGFRGLGGSRLLLQAAKKQAKDEGRDILWTLPRKSAWAAYQAFGFRQVSGWFEEEMEFGPNCVAVIEL